MEYLFLSLPAGCRGDRGKAWIFARSRGAGYLKKRDTASG